MNPLKAQLANLLFALALIMAAALFLGCRMLESRGKALASANATIATLLSTNEQQATEFQEQQLITKGLRLLLNNQNAALAKLDNQNRKTADELQQALATPPAGRPDCAREPLPGGALRLLQPTHAPGADPGGEAAATAGAGAPLPGA